MTLCHWSGSSRSLDGTATPHKVGNYSLNRQRHVLCNLNLDTEHFKYIKYYICYYVISGTDSATCVAVVIQLCCLLFNINVMYYVEGGLEVDMNNMLGILLPASLTDCL